MGFLTDWFLKRKVSAVVNDAEEGRKGDVAKNAIESFKGSPGWRSAVMLLLLVVEGLAESSGFETGPLFLVLRTAFGAIGVSPTEATSLGIDPEKLVVGLMSVWFACARLLAVYKERKAARAAEAAALAAMRAIPPATPPEAKA